MKTLILCTAVTTLGLLGCSHSQQVARSSANELPYQQHFKHGRGTTPANCSDSQQAARSSANELPYQQHFKHGHGPRTAPADQAECAPESSNAEQ
ncbi:hypothetical protein D187_007789 [Cystobacter fuscus DSM 2262]|uniref:Lipoprotein n=1 Tax=Cystobacter fuscus (strain ATCC 25194 / DSM 2262 / NBRC 100088 / M29) TaxID=1242864 RepID=S9P2E7_CYSF2|nr:hypothetical protein [Cystobacter fuscus]EPX56447.1 hypothetical protein D187_007789 [Cystobacter fuscus DSM 2262]